MIDEARAQVRRQVRRRRGRDAEPGQGDLAPEPVLQKVDEAVDRIIAEERIDQWRGATVSNGVSPASSASQGATWRRKAAAVVCLSAAGRDTTTSANPSNADSREVDPVLVLAITTSRSFQKINTFTPPRRFRAAIARFRVTASPR